MMIQRVGAGVPKTALVAVLLSLATACGGPLSHTVKISEVPAESRDKMVSTREAARKAELERDAADDLVANTKKEIETAETDLKSKKSDLAIAREMLDLEEAKESADRSAEVNTAETRVDNAKIAVAVAEAQLDLSEELLDHRKNLAAQAKAAWLLALAQHEVAKMNEVKSDDPAKKELKAEIDAQLQDKQREFDAAKERSAESEEEVNEAKEELADAAEG